MAQFSGSPSVQSYEVDVTAIVPSIATTTGALAGVFKWGPVGLVQQIADEKTLVQQYGPPSVFNAETWFTGANFLAYSTSLYLTRTANTSGNATSIVNTVLNAVTGSTNTFSNTVMLGSLVQNLNTYASDSFDPSVYYVAKYPGAMGNSLQVSVCDSAAAYSSQIALTPNAAINASSTSISFTVGSNVASVVVTPSGTGTANNTLAVANNVATGLVVGDYVAAGNASVGIQMMKVTSIGTPTQSGTNAAVTISFSAPFNRATNYTDVVVNRQWQYATNVAKAPTTSAWQAQVPGANNAAVDQVHVVVVDQDGLFSGTPGTILETFAGLSRATDAVDPTTGQTNYYATVINQSSNYIWWANDRSGAASAPALSLVSSTNTTPLAGSFTNGQDGLPEGTVPLSTVASGYDLFLNDALNISLIMQGTAKGGTYGEGLANYIIGNIVQQRHDCIVMVSAPSTATVNVPGQEVTNLINFRNAVTSTSYAVMDSAYKYQYDKYNNVYRWLPLNGDIAGIIAQTDLTNAPWWSPAGYNRGSVKNVIKLSYNPSKTYRDTLFNADINPVVTQPGTGTVLLGDKTLIGTTSAFNAINVRRLFIVLRKSISIAAQSLLFEFNDAFTQQQFVNMVDPYLRNIQGQRGITSYNIIADGSVNTPDVINNDGFVGVIQIVPARAIRYINLYFQAVNNGVSFSEVAGSAIV